MARVGVCTASHVGCRPCGASSVVATVNGPARSLPASVPPPLAFLAALVATLVVLAPLDALAFFTALTVAVVDALKAT